MDNYNADLKAISRLDFLTQPNTQFNPDDLINRYCDRLPELSNILVKLYVDVSEQIVSVCDSNYGRFIDFTRRVHDLSEPIHSAAVITRRESNQFEKLRSELCSHHERCRWILDRLDELNKECSELELALECSTLLQHSQDCSLVDVLKLKYFGETSVLANVKCIKECSQRFVDETIDALQNEFLSTLAVASIK
ncbi:hypothetical protein ACOME3_004964 [Neoechinorhynchus agilis]